MLLRSLLASQIVCSVLLLLVLSVALARGRSPKRRGRGSRWWNLAYAEDPTNMVLDLHSVNNVSPKGDILLPPLKKKQRKLVEDNPGTRAATIRGMKMAVAECKHQFRKRRWDCATNEYARGRNIFGKIVQKGCRETAFVYAITSAGIAHAVSRACREGFVSTCACERRRPGSWQWGGCGDNLTFGGRFARRFVDAEERVRDIRGRVNLHNNQVGRTHVKAGTQHHCKCHGISGSCATTTCWKQLPPFRSVSETLKDRFDGASRVSVTNRGSVNRRSVLTPFDPHHKQATDKDLVYYEDSPNFCHPDKYLGHAGTKGRSCNASSIGVDGCDLMCCGRGHASEFKTELVRCNCAFEWCCTVECKNCTQKRLVHTCL